MASPLLALAVAVQQGADRPEICDEPVFTPFEAKPEIREPSKAFPIIERHYTRSLRDAKKNGRVFVWLCIDEEGKLWNHKLAQSSGDEKIDEAGIRAAVAIAELVGYTLARNRGQPVTVWFQQPVAFTIRTVPHSRRPRHAHPSTRRGRGGPRGPLFVLRGREIV